MILKKNHLHREKIFAEDMKLKKSNPGFSGSYGCNVKNPLKKTRRSHDKALARRQGEISECAEPFAVTVQQVVDKPKGISHADMVGRTPTPWVDRGLGVVGDRQFTMVMMMYIIAFILT